VAIAGARDAAERQVRTRGGGAAGQRLYPRRYLSAGLAFMKP
jgi:hypothetical protein